MPALDSCELSVFNPHGKPLEELRVIYGFNNGGCPGLYSALAIADDGVILGGHGCSHETYIARDLGIISGYRPDRHEKEYRPHFPDGYRMEFVPSSEIADHVGLQKAFDAARNHHDGGER